ncbi:MAG TPA: hypothetical protein VMV79_01700 [Alphaproteobacteria bacterium]|nr:hypothetical protein [Alphaproteobacteria bacterium]
MTSLDLRALCTALGFTAVVMKGGRVSSREGALQAAAFARLIEDYCRTAAPEAFHQDGMTNFGVAPLAQGDFDF